MATPLGRTANFEVGGVKLYHHHAVDSHGTTAHTYMADGHVVSRSEFLKIIRDSLEDAKPYICQALNLMKFGG
uniref:Uncharacterized protein n=1 Tax=Serratia phage Kevin TaxID=3161161 RepID=A0AAU8L045_9CAUD